MVAEIVLVFFLVASGFFGFVGSFGLLKLRDPMSRLHAPTKASTLGVGALLIASLLDAWLIDGGGSVHELLITLFLLLTAPITALVIAKAHIFRHVDRTDLPACPPDTKWAVLQTPQTDQEDTPKTT